MKLCRISVILYFIYIFILEFFLKASGLSVSNRLVILGASASVFFLWQGVMDFRERKQLYFFQLLAVGCFLQLGLGGVYAGVLIARGFQEMLSQIGILPVEHFPEALYLMQVGALSFFAGGYVKGDASQKKILALQSFQPTRYLSVTVIWIFVFVGWICKIMIAKGHFGSDVLGQLVTNFPLMAIFLLSSMMLNSRKKMLWGFQILIIIIVELWFARESTGRSHFLTVFFPMFLAMGMHLGAISKQREPVSLISGRPGPAAPARLKTRRRGRFGLYVAGFTVGCWVLAVLFPAAAMVKAGEAENITQALRYVGKNIFSDIGKVHQFPDKGIFAFVLRMSLIDASGGIIVDLVHNGDVMGYDPLQLFAASFVPRAFWHDKPIITTGMWFVDYLSHGNTDLNTSLALSATGELYWAYGWYGMIAIMFVTGLFFAYVWQFCSVYAYRNPFAAVTLVTIMRCAFDNFEGQWSAPVSLVILLSLATKGSSLIRFPTFVMAPSKKIAAIKG